MPRIPGTIMAGSSLAEGGENLWSPVNYDYNTQRLLSGLAYTVSTGTQAIASGSYLNIMLSNPAGSGVNYVFTTRAFACNIISGNAPPEYIRWDTASTFPTGGTAVTIKNRQVGGPAPAGTFTYQIGTAPPTGTNNSSGFIPTGGTRLDLDEEVILAPGTNLIYSLGGPGTGFAAATRALGVFLFFARSV